MSCARQNLKLLCNNFWSLDITRKSVQSFQHYHQQLITSFTMSWNPTLQTQSQSESVELVEWEEKIGATILENMKYAKWRGNVNLQEKGMGGNKDGGEEDETIWSWENCTKSVQPSNLRAEAQSIITLSCRPQIIVDNLWFPRQTLNTFSQSARGRLPHKKSA